MSTAPPRLDNLAALADGWLDGEGRAPTPHAIATARSVLSALAEHPDAPMPRLYPTPEGAVQAEWEIGRVSADLLFPAAPDALTANALHVDTGAELDLTTSAADPRAAARRIAAWLRALPSLAA